MRENGMKSLPSYKTLNAQKTEKQTFKTLKDFLQTQCVANDLYRRTPQQTKHNNKPKEHFSGNFYGHTEKHLKKST